MSAAEELARVRALVFEPYSMFRVAPMRGALVNVSERGDRSTGREKPWPPAANAIFVFGGSTAFGYGLADGETIPAQLERIIGRDVYNFATPNHNAEQERIRLEQLLLDGARRRASGVPRLTAWFTSAEPCVARDHVRGQRAQRASFTFACRGRVTRHDRPAGGRRSKRSA